MLSAFERIENIRVAFQTVKTIFDGNEDYNKQIIVT